MLGRREAAALLGGAHGGAEGGIGRVRFGCGGEVDHGLRQRQLALRAAQEVVHVLGGQRLHHRLRVGKADVLDRHPHQPPRDVEPVLAAVEHAREPVERRIRVGAAHRLVQRADQVVVPVARLVVERRPPLHQLRQRLAADRGRAGRDRAEDLLRHVERRAPVAVGHGDERCARLRVERQRPALHGLGTGQQLLQRRLVEAVEGQHHRAREQGAVQLERRVLGGGAHQGDGAVLHVGQEPVLLRPVEAVDLVDEEERALAGLAPPLGAVERLAQVLHAREDGRELLEGQLRGVRQQPRHRGLARARRPPQDHALQPAAPEHARERAVGADQVVLAHDLGELRRPQPVGEGARRLRLHPRGLKQVGHAPIIAGAASESERARDLR